MCKVIDINPEQERCRRIKTEVTKLRKLCVDVDKEERTLPYSTIDELAFMKVTLEELKENVNRVGVVTEMDQGKYTIDRENPALKSYVSMIQRYNAMIKLLFEILEKKAPDSASERDLGAFIQRK